MLDFKCPYCGTPSSEAMGWTKERREDTQISTFFCKCGKTYERRSISGGGGGTWNWAYTSNSSVGDGGNGIEETARK